MTTELEKLRAVNFDTWEQTDAAIRVIRAAFILLDPSAPKKDTPEAKVREAELQELRKFAISVHHRRIALNIHGIKN